MIGVAGSPLPGGQPAADHRGMRPLAETCGIYHLQQQHLARLQQLAADPAIAATTRVPQPYPPDGAQRFFADAEAMRAAGTGRVFAIEDAGQLVGVVGLHGVRDGSAELGFWVGTPHQRRGYASFGVRTVLPFAFQNLALATVWAESLATNEVAHRVLVKHGFVRGGERVHGETRWPADVPLVRFTLTPERWRAHRDAPALARLHPTLRRLLDAELAAGNEVRETSSGWPDADSVLVTLRHPFRAMPSPLPDGVTYGQPNDPHWWRGELLLRSPRQLLVY